MFHPKYVSTKPYPRDTLRQKYHTHAKHGTRAPRYNGRIPAIRGSWCRYRAARDCMYMHVPARRLYMHMPCAYVLTAQFTDREQQQRQHHHFGLVCTGKF